MNNHHFLKSHYFFYISHLVAITIISFLPNFAISQSPPPDARWLNKIAPYKTSKDDSFKTSASKQIKTITEAIAINYAHWEVLKRLSPTAAAAAAPILTAQTSSHRASEKVSIATADQLTDTRPYDPSISTGEFNQRDWDDRRYFATINLQDLQRSLIDQELDDYVEKIYQQTQKDAEYYKGKGYTFDPKSNRVTLPGGKSIPAKDIFTKKGFKALGLPPEKFKEFKKQEKKIERQAIRQGNAKIAGIIKSAKNKAKRLAAKAQSDKNSPYNIANQKVKGIKENGITNIQKNQGINGNGYTTSSFSSDWRPPSFQDILNNQQKLQNIRGLSSGSSDSNNELKMLSKQYGDDLIGLSNNNIFDMVHRQYLRKRSQLNGTADFIIE